MTYLCTHTEEAHKTKTPYHFLLQDLCFIKEMQINNFPLASTAFMDNLQPLLSVF